MLFDFNGRMAKNRFFSSYYWYTLSSIRMSHKWPKRLANSLYPKLKLVLKSLRSYCNRSILERRIWMHAYIARGKKQTSTHAYEKRENKLSSPQDNILNRKMILFRIFKPYVWIGKRNILMILVLWNHNNV